MEQGFTFELNLAGVSDEQDGPGRVTPARAKGLRRQMTDKTTLDAAVAVVESG